MERHLIEKIHITGKTGKLQRQCTVCTVQKKRKESICWRPNCKAHLYMESCFKLSHMQIDY